MTTSNLLARLPPRPPTPPKDFSSSDPIVPAKELLAKSLSATLLETPETPTDLLTDYFSTARRSSSSDAGSRGTKRKRVNFILTPTHHCDRGSNPPSSPPSLPKISPDPRQQRQQHRSPLCTRHSNTDHPIKPTKSILKISRGILSSDTTVGSDDLFHFTFKSPLTFKSDKIKMIEDVCRQLANPDKSSRLDAYRNLSDILKGNHDIIGLEEFKAQQPLLVAFMSRDLEAWGGTDHRDSQITVEVLKLLTYLAERNVMKETTLMSLVDWIILLFEAPKPPKALVNNALMLLFCIKPDDIFLHPQKPDRSARTERLFDTLKNLHLRVNGKNVLLLRLDFYKKLVLIGHKSVFLGAKFWLRSMLEALMKGTRDSFERGLSLGNAAANRYGDRKEVGRSLINVLQEPPSARIAPVQPTYEPQEDGSDSVQAVRPFMQYFLSRLLQFLNPEHGNAEMVPRIWSVIVRMMRHDSAHFRRWDGWGQWLTLLQKCFNSSDVHVKVSANTAWGELIWASQDRIHKDDTIRKSLFRPIQSQLERKENDKSKTAAELTFCIFLYYTLQPRIEDSQVASVWDEYIAKALAVRGDGKYANPKFSARVLLSLLGDEEQKVWGKDRLLSRDKLGPEALIRLDPRWVCTHISLVLTVLDGHIRLLRPDDLESPIKIDRAGGVLKVWSRLVASVAEAGRREVRASNMSIKATLSLLKFAIGWLNGSGVNLYNLSARLIDVLLDHTDSLPLGLKCLFREGSSIRFNPSFSTMEASTHPPLQSALDLILDFLSPDCTKGWAQSISADRFSKALGIRLQSLSSRRALLTELCDISSRCVCTYAIPGRWEEGENTHACQKGFLWSEIANRFVETLLQPSGGLVESQEPPGQGLEYGAKILVNGLGHSVTSLADWNDILETLSEKASSVSGECGRILAIVSPIATALVGNRLDEGSDSSTCITGLPSDYLIPLLRVLPTPGNEAEFNLARQKLWGDFSARFDPNSNHLAPVFNLLIICLSSDSNILRRFALNTWKRIQNMPAGVNVPDNLLNLLQQTPKLTSTQLGKTSGSRSRDLTKDFLGNTSQVEVSEMVDMEREIDSPSPKFLTAEHKSDLHDSAMTGLRKTPEKPHIPARDRDITYDVIPSSPPEYHYPVASLVHAMPSGVGIEKTVEEESPLPAFLSLDEPQRQDDSPTPASRRPSHSQSEVLFAELPSPSPNRPIRRFSFRSDPVDSFVDVEVDSTPSKRRRTKAKKHKKDKKWRAVSESPRVPAIVSEDRADSTARALKAQLMGQLSPTKDWNANKAAASNDRDPTVIAKTSLSADKEKDNDENEDIRQKAVRRTSSLSELTAISELNIAHSHRRQSSRQAARRTSQVLAEMSDIPAMHTELDPASASHGTTASYKKGERDSKRNRGRHGLAQAVGAKSPASATTTAAEESDMEDCIIVGSSKVFSLPQKPTRQTPEALKSVASPIDQTSNKKEVLGPTLVDDTTPSAGIMQDDIFTGSKRKRNQRTRRQDGKDVAVASSANLKQDLWKDCSENVQMAQDVQQVKAGMAEELLLRPNKKPRLAVADDVSQTPGQGIHSAFNSPVAGISDAARGILTRLRCLLEDVQTAVLGRTEAREIHRSLNKLNAATIDAEERGD